MDKAIRHPDGTMISSSEWSAIKASARLIKADLLSLPAPRDRRAKDQKKTKIYFRTYFRKEWEAAVAKLEMHQPLLALCASHWKAEHVLGNTLLVKVAERSEDDESNTLSMPPTVSSKLEGKKRAGKHHSCEKKRRRRGNETVVSSSKQANLDGGIPDSEPNGALLLPFISFTDLFIL